MRVVISATGPRLDATVDPRFGRCLHFMVVETDDLTFETIDNVNRSLGGGAGIQSAQLVAQTGAQAVLTGNCGPNAHETLTAAGIAVYVGCAGTVSEVVAHFKSGELQPVSAPNVDSHAGMGDGDPNSMRVGSSNGGGMGMSGGGGGGGGKGRGGGMGGGGMGGGGMGGGGKGRGGGGMGGGGMGGGGGKGRGGGMGGGGGKGRGGGMGGGGGKGRGGGGRGGCGGDRSAGGGGGQPSAAEQFRRVSQSTGASSVHAEHDLDVFAPQQNRRPALAAAPGWMRRETDTSRSEQKPNSRPMTPIVDHDRCSACGICLSACPEGAISLGEFAEIDPQRCTCCGACIFECPNEALSFNGRASLQGFSA